MILKNEIKLKQKIKTTENLDKAPEKNEKIEKKRKTMEDFIQAKTNKIKETVFF